MKVRFARARRGAGAAALALALAVGGSACAGQSPNTAAVINGQTISELDLEAIAQDLNGLRAAAPQVSKQEILVTLLLRPFVLDAARRSGKMVSGSEARALVTNGIPNPSQQTLDFIQTSLISRKLPQPELSWVVQQFRNASITVNPKYGTVDPVRGIGPAQQNWIEHSATVPQG